MKRKSLIVPALLLAAFAAANLGLAPALRQASSRARSAYSAGQTEAVLRERHQSAFAQILGEVRATSADLMFVKTNRYFHVGIGYQPKVRADATDEGARFAECGPGVPTLIRSAGEDFRGFLGNIERQVKPYRDASEGHTHTSEAELIPWFRVMTLTNPQFIRGYRVGGMALAKEGKWQEGLDFMNEGVRNNPDNPELFRLHQTIASFHRFGHFRPTYPWHDTWIRAALEPALKGYELGKQRRPPGGVSEEPYRGLVWTADAEEDFALGAHLIPQLYREMAESQDDLALLHTARRWAEELHTLMPEYRPMARLIGKIDKEIAEWDKKEDKKEGER